MGGRGLGGRDARRSCCISSCGLRDRRTTRAGSVARARLVVARRSPSPLCWFPGSCFPQSAAMSPMRSRREPLWDATWPMLVGAALAAGLWALGDPLPRVPAGDIVVAEEAAFRACGASRGHVRAPRRAAQAMAGGRPVAADDRPHSRRGRVRRSLTRPPAPPKQSRRNKIKARRNKNKAEPQQNQRPAQQNQNRVLAWNLSSGSRCFNSLRLNFSPDASTSRPRSAAGGLDRPIG